MFNIPSYEDLFLYLVDKLRIRHFSQQGTEYRFEYLYPDQRTKSATPIPM